MKVLKKLPKQSYVFLIVLIIIIVNMVTNSGNKTNNSEIINEKPDSSEKIKNQYNYMSSNTSNSDFKYDDIKKTELAVYDKYIKN